MPPTQPRRDECPHCSAEEDHRPLHEGLIQRSKTCGVCGEWYLVYLAAWESDDPEIVRDRLDRISSTAKELIDMLEHGV